MSETWLTDVLGQVLFIFTKIRPMLPTHLHMILSSLLPIYAGAHASLHRPVSAAKPPKPKSEDGDDEDRPENKPEEETDIVGGLNFTDVLLFPLMAGGVLTGLYFIIKYLEDPAILSTILNVYLSGFGMFGIAAFLADGIEAAFSYVFPDKYLHRNRIWAVDERRRLALPVKMSSDDVHPGTRSSPLPSALAFLPIPNSFLWTLRSLAHKPACIIDLQLSTATARLRPTPIRLLTAQLSVLIVAYYNLVDRPWWLTNLCGFSYSYSAFQLMSPTSFAIGSALLTALFFYDIYMVFFTPMMITVASKLDIPAKLVFPRPGAEPGSTQYSMLGLGDIVIPGIMIALALRFDLFLFYLKKQKLASSADSASTVSDANVTQSDATKALTLSVPHYTKATYARVTGTWGSRFWLGRQAPLTVGGTFPKPYFISSMVGYVVGLLVTIIIMVVFEHGQPALLYLVPGVLGSLFLCGAVRGELGIMWKYTEDADEARKVGLDSRAALLPGNVVDRGVREKRKEENGDAEGEGKVGLIEGGKDDPDGSAQLGENSLNGKGDGNADGKSRNAAKDENKPNDESKEKSKDKPRERRLFSLVISLPPTSKSHADSKQSNREQDTKRFHESFVELAKPSEQRVGEPGGKRRRLS